MEKNEKKLTRSDINKTMFRWYFSTEISLNYERMQSISFTYALMPVLQKLYDTKDELKQALQRHLALYNTNCTAGGLILGTVLAMEEEKANEGNISDEAGGSFFGLLMLFLGNFILMCELVLTTNLTYIKGREAIKDVLSSRLMTDVLEGANILGMMMMGALTASMVTLVTPLAVTFGETKMKIQDNFDNLIPGLFAILVLFLFYFLIGKKKVSISKVIFGTIIVSIALSFFGIV